MLHRLCGPPSIPLSFILANVLPRWDTYHFRLATESENPTASVHRLRRGLPGVSNPVRSPRFRPSASVYSWPPAFAIGVLCDIYAFHRYTTCSGNPTVTQDLQYQRQSHG